MTSKLLRRLAADHASLHTKGLPPNYLFPPGKEDDLSDLTSVSLLLAGPEGTAFAHGLYSLDLTIPPTYPHAAPTAHFRTKIFHPNVDPATGAVCVDTLKRDWKPELTLRHVLITITCLLVYPNPASALNAEAGRLVETDFKEFERKAQLWARMHAPTPLNLRDAAEEARKRGNEDQDSSAQASSSVVASASNAADKRKRKDRRPEGEDVFIREDSVKTSTPPKQSVNPVAPPPAPPAARGLGIDILPESSLNASAAQLDTPTQPTGRSRRNKPEELPASSSTAALATPVPLFRPPIHSNPSTPSLGRPEPKRRRVTPETAPPKEPQQDVTPRRTRKSDIGTQDDVESQPWLSWQTASPLSSPEEDEVRRKKRRRVEKERLDSVGRSLLLYNAGRFGPRVGVERL